MNKHLYRFTEDALRDYPRDLMRLQALREYLSAPIGPDPTAHVKGGSLPEQERVLNRIERSREHKALAARVGPVSLFLTSLPAEDRRLVDLRYFRALSWAEVAHEMHMSVATCMQRRAPRIVAKAAHILFGDLV